MRSKLRIIVYLCAAIVIGFVFSSDAAAEVVELLRKVLDTLTEPIFNYEESLVIAVLASILLIMVLPPITIPIMLFLGLIAWVIERMPVSEKKKQPKQVDSDKLEDKDESAAPAIDTQTLGNVIIIAIIIALCIWAYRSL